MNEGAEVNKQNKQYLPSNLWGGAAPLAVPHFYHKKRPCDYI